MFDDIKDLSQCRDIFIEYLKHHEKNNQDRNKDWFPYLIKNIDLYLYWTIVFKEQRIVAFSAIQEHNFEKGTVRILSRTFFDPEIRLQPGYNFWSQTPVAPMAKKQLQWLSRGANFEKIIITMEPRHRRDYFVRIVKKINDRAGACFEMIDEPIQTYPNQSASLFQHAAQMSRDSFLEYELLDSR